MWTAEDTLLKYKWKTEITDKEITALLRMAEIGVTPEQRERFKKRIIDILTKDKGDE